MATSSGRSLLLVGRANHALLVKPGRGAPQVIKPRLVIAVSSHSFPSVASTVP